jgi:2-polyprenyl-3-methyl-5-hydroxy-6-metoxy-1,4-benzoquinol methylase
MDKTTLKRAIKKARVTDKYSFIKNLCKGCSVLDVGCIGQDAEINSPNWLHQQIKNVATEVTGVDIILENIEELNKQGYRMLHVSELADRHETYDVIVMADVIEHVSNPVEFLQFYSRFLKPSGSMVISTPNANRAINFLSILSYNNYSVNDEHVCWFCPMTLLEVIHRSQLKLVEFYWLKKYYNFKGLNIFTRIITWTSDMLALCRKNFNQNFLVVVTK